MKTNPREPGWFFYFTKFLFDKRHTLNLLCAMKWIVAKMHGDNTRKLDRVVDKLQLPVSYYRPFIEHQYRRKGKSRTINLPIFFDYIFLDCDFALTGTEWLTFVPITLVEFGGQIATLNGFGLNNLRQIAAKLKGEKVVSQDWLNKPVMIKGTAMGDVYGTVVNISNNGLDIEIKCFSRKVICHQINTEYVVRLRN